MFFIGYNNILFLLYIMEQVNQLFDQSIGSMNQLQSQCPFVDEFKSEYVKCFYNRHRVQEFDWKLYIEQYTDLKKGRHNELAVYKMWIDGGRKNGFVVDSKEVYQGFPWSDYLNYNQNLRKNGIVTEIQAVQHWINHGRNEKRKVNTEMIVIDEKVRDIFIDKLMRACVTQMVEIREFDWKRYLNRYPDVIRGGFNGEKGAYRHWELSGRNEKRTAFETGNNNCYYGFPWVDYVTNHSDLSDKVTEIDCYNHWVDFGRKEGRCPWKVNYKIIPECKIFKQNKLNDDFLQRVNMYIKYNLFGNNSQLMMETELNKITNYIRNNIFMHKNKRIVMVMESQMDNTAGNTIMCSSWMNALMKEDNHITLFSVYPVSEIFTRNLKYNNYTCKVFDSNALLLNEMGKTMNNMDIAFIRSKNLLQSLNQKEYLHKIIFYGLDIHLDGIALMQNKFHSIITQSEELKTKYIEKGVLADKIEVVSPFPDKYEFELPERKDNEIRLIYCGTLRDEENILEIIEEFQKIHKERPEVVLKIVYGKIMNNDPDFEKNVNKYIKDGVDGIIFKHNLSHKDACYEIATSDIGICWRKNGWGDNGEVSTKVKEYEMYGVFRISNITHLRNRKFNIKHREICINDTYYIKQNCAFLLDDILDVRSRRNFIKKPVVNVKFKEHFKEFLHEHVGTQFEYDFTYTTTTTNKMMTLNLYKNVFYKILSNETCGVYLYNIDNVNENIYRNCLHGKELYFTVKHNGPYYLNIKTPSTHEVCIQNLISINYICNDNVYMLNLSHQREKYKIKELILNKMGINVNRFEAVNGQHNDYDDLWEKVKNAPLSEGEEKIGRKYLTRGSLGYLLSMEKIFSSVKSKYVCIFDDDVLIKKSLSLDEMTLMLVKLSRFNILKFGSSQWDFKNVVYRNNFYYPTDLSNGSFACIYRSVCYNNILEKIRLFNEPFDFGPIRQFNSNNVLIVNPNMMIAELDNVSTITNKKRTSEYGRFKWDTDKYIELPYTDNQKYIHKNNNDSNKTHFLLGITTFNRTDYFKECINSLASTLNTEYFFTIFIAKGLDICETEDKEIEDYIIKTFKEFNNINIIVNYSYLHYIYYSSNYILKYSETCDYDFGFILNDDILFEDNWYISYYEASMRNKIEHLCWLKNTDSTILDKERALKNNGCVLKANGVLLTFTKNVVKNAGLFNENDFKVRGQSHLEWSLRCCNKGFNNKNTFYDIVNSNELVKLNTINYESAISKSSHIDKVFHFVDKYELERRNKIIDDLFKST